MSFHIQIGKIKALLIDSRPEECFLNDLEILVYLSLNVLIKKVLIKKKKKQSVRQSVSLQITTPDTKKHKTQPGHKVWPKM